MPLLRRNRTDYKTPRFPRGAEWILFIDENGVDDGPYKVNDFVPGPGGVWAIQSAGRPLFLRIIEQQGDRITTLDGTGKAFRFRMVAV